MSFSTYLQEAQNSKTKKKVARRKLSETEQECIKLVDMFIRECGRYFGDETVVWSMDDKEELPRLFDTIDSHLRTMENVCKKLFKEFYGLPVQFVELEGNEEYPPEANTMRVNTKKQR